MKLWALWDFQSLKSPLENSISVMGYTYKARNLNQTRCARLALSGLSDSYNGPEEAQINILSNVMIKQFLCVMHSRKSWGFDLELFLIYPPSSLLRYSIHQGQMVLLATRIKHWSSRRKTGHTSNTHTSASRFDGRWLFKSFFASCMITSTLSPRSTSDTSPTVKHLWDDPKSLTNA